MDGGGRRDERDPKDRTRTVPLEVCIYMLNILRMTPFRPLPLFSFFVHPSSPWPTWSPQPIRGRTALTRCGSGTGGTFTRDGLGGVHEELVLRFVYLLNFTFFSPEVCTKLNCLRADASPPTTRALSAATSTLSSTTETSNSSHNSWRTTQAECSRPRAQGSANISGFREECERFQTILYQDT